MKRTFYTFYDMAKNPTDSQGTQNQMGFQVWSESKVNLGKELDALISTLPTNASAPVWVLGFLLSDTDRFCQTWRRSCDSANGVEPHCQ